MKRKDLTWQQFNRWTVIWDWKDTTRKKTNWKMQPVRNLICQCECWTIKEVKQWNLVNWTSKSCWCHRKEICKVLMGKMRPLQFWENNPNWRWGIMKEYQRKRNLERNTPESRIWTKQIKERDGECKRCWSVAYLQAHHIDSWVDNPENRFELWNWICLCKNCHHSFHKEYWFWNNNLEQLDIFLA